MNTNINRIFSILLFVLLSSSANVLASETREVRLVLQITVDGLRADLLNRYAMRFGEGGFRYFLDQGIVYTNAHYQHANTETIVGHTTLATGAHPSQHGMVGNVWFDRTSRELAYNIEDPDSPLLATRNQEASGDQVDPAQQLSRTQGRSPAAILVPTLTDTLAAYYAGESRLFSVAGKDRSAVSMAGHAGKAFWFSTDSGDFVTSRYYYDAYPEWVAAWNAQRKADRYAGASWQLLHEPHTYLLAGQDDRAYESDLKGYGRVFPHPFGEPGDNLFYTRLLASPVADRLALDFSKTLIAREDLGKDGIPDYLSISLSATDAVNHFFGPSSLENEDVILQLDRLLADFLAFVDRSVGLANTLLVLSADHGMADMPEYMTELGYPAERVDTDDVIAAANRAGKQLFGIDGVVHLFYRPYVYLDDVKIADAGLSLDVVAQAIAGALTELTGIEVAIARNGSEWMQTTPLAERVRHNFHARRSGDIYLVQRPYWFMFSKGPVVAMHGTPWRYDTHVPVIFAGAGLLPETSARPVHPVDVAPTISAVLGIAPPASATGTVLEEVVGQQAID